MGQLDEGPAHGDVPALYEQPIYPKNLYLDRAPYKHAEYRREVIDKQIRKMHDAGIWAPPSDNTPRGER